MNNFISPITRSVLVAVAVSSSTAACSPSASWVEEVELSDGRVITVVREHRWRTMQPIGSQKTYLDDRMTLEINASGSDLPVWEGTGEQPMLLDVDRSNGEYFLVTSPSLCDRYRSFGEPEPPYVEYRPRGGAWTREPLSKAVIRRRPNLLVWPSPMGEPERVTLADKRDRTPEFASRQKTEIVAEGGLPGCP